MLHFYDISIFLKHSPTPLTKTLTFYFTNPSRLLHKFLTCPEDPHLQQKLWGMGRNRRRLGVNDNDVRSITASFHHFQSKGRKAIDYGKRGSNKKNRRINEVLLGSFKPAIFEKIIGLDTWQDS
jgi:hypothetical protein